MVQTGGLGPAEKPLAFELLCHQASAGLGTGKRKSRCLA